MYPGHVAGSLCGAAMSSDPSSTIGHERRSNARAPHRRGRRLRRGRALEERAAAAEHGRDRRAQPRAVRAAHARPSPPPATCEARPCSTCATPKSPPRAPPRRAQRAALGQLVRDEGCVRPRTAAGSSCTRARRLRRRTAARGASTPSACSSSTGSSSTRPAARSGSNRSTWTSSSSSCAQDAVILLDVREADERDEGYIAGSRHIPYRLLPAVSDGLADRTVVTICSTGARAGIAASVLARTRVDARPVLDGGVEDWRAPRRPHDRVPPLRLVDDGMTTPPVNAVARELFAPLGPTYDRYARLLSLGQDPRWRRFLVSRVSVAPDRDGPRRGVGNRCGGDRARAPHRLLGRRSRPERGDARRRTPTRRTGRTLGASEPRPRECRATAVPGRRVRRADVHVPAPLRRRSRRDHARACTGDAQRRDDRIARVRRSSRATLALALGALRPTRPPARRPRDLAGLARGGPLPRPEHPCAAAARAARGSLARGRHQRRALSAPELSAAASSCGAGGSERRAAPGVLRARDRRLARLRHAAPPALHALASVLRRDRRRTRTDPSRRATALGSRGVLPRARRRRACARRAQRTPAADRDPGSDPRRARDRVDRRRRRHRPRRSLRVDAVAAPVRRLRDVHRRGVQPRALRRPLPLRPLVRARLGRVSRPDGVRRRGRDRPPGGPARRSVCGVPQPGAAAPLDAGAHDPAPHRSRLGRDLVHGRPRGADHATTACSALPRRPSTRSPGRSSRSRSHCSCCASASGPGRTQGARASCGHAQQPVPPGSRARASRPAAPQRVDQVRRDDQLRADEARAGAREPSSRHASPRCSAALRSPAASAAVRRGSPSAASLRAARARAPRPGSRA